MGVENEIKLLALLLPSKGRFLDLLLTLSLTPVNAPKGFKVHFVVCANYHSLQLVFLRSLFPNRLTVIDERSLEWRGMAGAYNYALGEATKMGARWVALWADDLLPERNSWLRELFSAISDPTFRFGIFSSDEGNHHGRFGWNVFAGYPCAHFYVACVDSLPGYVLNPKLRAYVGDNEIAINRTKADIPIDLLPIRVIHQPTANKTRAANASAYKIDLETLYEIHPELCGRLDAVVLHGNVSDPNCRFIVDINQQLRFDKSTPHLKIEDFMATAKYANQRFALRAIGCTRKLWNEVILSPGQAMRGGMEYLRRRINPGTP